MNSEIPPNNLYISVSRQHVCPKDTAIVMALVSKTTFLNPLWGGVFYLNLMRYGDIPSSHGDIPVVSIQIHEVESTKQQKPVLSKFQPYGVYLRVLLVSGTQVSWLVRSFSSDYRSLRQTSCGHLYLRLLTPCSFQSRFNISKHSEIANDIREIIWLVSRKLWTTSMISTTPEFIKTRNSILLNRG